MLYPLRNDRQQQALNDLPSSSYATTDKPFLFTNRYSVTGGFEINNLDDKELVDDHGAQDNQYWYQRNIDQKMEML